MENKNQQNQQSKPTTEQQKSGQPAQNKQNQGDGQGFDRNQKQDHSNPQRASEENLDENVEEDVDPSGGNRPDKGNVKREEQFPTR